MLDTQKLQNTLGAHADAHLAAGDYGAVAIRVYHHGHKAAEVFRNCDEKSVFRLASMTKPVIGVATMIAQEMGLFSVFDSVSKYIPEYADLRVAAWEDGKLVPGEKTDMKIFQGMNHTCGIFGGFAEDGHPAPYEVQVMPREMRETVTDAVKNVPKFLTGYPSGTDTNYCAFAGCDICAEIISRTSGMPFEDFLQKHLFDPLGMADTTFTPNADQWSRMVQMTTRRDGKAVPVDMGGHVFGDFALTYHSGGAALISTPEDYTRFMLMLANGGSCAGHTFLSPKSMALMTFPTTPEDLRGTSPYQSWGLTVRVTRHDPVLPDGCFGWSGAYGTHFWVDPTNDLAVLFMKNSCYDGGSEAFTAREVERDVMAAVY